MTSRPVFTQPAGTARLANSVMATSGNFVGKLCRPLCRKIQHFSKQLDKVGDEDTRSAIMRTAGRAPQGVAHEYFRARPAPAPHPVGSTRLLCRDRPR